jgi:DNA-binding MarR family transcriptional regulator
MGEKENEAPAGRMAQECLGVRLRVLNRVVSGIYDEALRPFGLKISQLNVLVVVARMGEAQPARLCQILHMDASTLSRNVERIRKRGWLRAAPGEDGRTQLLSITPEGRELLAAVVPAWEQAQDQVAELLGTEGTAALRALARRLFPGREGP